MNNQWSRWDEFRQRLATARAFIKFAWICLWTDSSVFAVEYFTMSQRAGERFVEATRQLRGE